MYGELNPLGGGDPIPLKKHKLLVGRRPSCDICLPFPNVSSEHCELTMENGYWKIRDLGSSNGLKVNGMRLESKFLLPGDEVTIAKHKFEIQYEALAEGPPPDEDNPFELSLMEKAGLVSQGKKKRASSSHESDVIGDAGTTPIKPRKKSKGNDQEDEIMKWLSGD